MSVLHPGIQAEAAGRWKTVGAVANQKHPALPERLRNLHADAPDRAVEQRHIEIRNSDMPARDFDEFLIGPWPLAIVFG